MNDGRQSISKVEAAQRQLNCAVELWFADGDELSIHTLAAAAYQLVHDLKEHKGVARTLLYDATMIKPEQRKKWIDHLKKPVNFSKHADNDPDDVLEFNPRLNIGFLMAAAAGLRLLGAPTSDVVNALIFWIVVNKPNWATEKFRKLYEERLGIDNLQEFKLVPKRDFLKIYLRGSNAINEIDMGNIPLA
jgi:hypothetical protein